MKELNEMSPVELLNLKNSLELCMKGNCDVIAQFIENLRKTKRFLKIPMFGYSLSANYYLATCEWKNGKYKGRSITEDFELCRKIDSTINWKWILKQLR